MGGKPSKGTSKDMRLKENKPAKPAAPTQPSAQKPGKKSGK